MKDIYVHLQKDKYSILFRPNIFIEIPLIFYLLIDIFSTLQVILFIDFNLINDYNY